MTFSQGEQRQTLNAGGTRSLETVTLCVIHYTGSDSMQGTLEWFANPDARVSAHHVVDLDGRCVNYESWERVLWHAGKSQWKGRTNCNVWSVGIELVGRGDFFNAAQYETAGQIITELSRACPISWVVGHQHIAPGRKSDPGKFFKWDALRARIPARVSCV